MKIKYLFITSILFVMLMISGVTASCDGVGPSNGDFELGDFTGWDVDDEEPGAYAEVAYYDESTYVANLSVYGDYLNETVISQTIDNTSISRVFFRYKVVSTGGNNEERFRLILHNAYYIEGGYWATNFETSETTEWIEVDMATGDVIEPLLFEFELSGASEDTYVTVYIDDVCFYDIPLPQCGGLVNGDFETGDATGWSTDFFSGNGGYDINESYASGSNYGAFLFVDTPTDFSGLYQTVDFSGEADPILMYVTYKVIAADGFTGFDIMEHDPYYDDFYTLYRDYEVGDWRTVAFTVYPYEFDLFFSVGYNMADGGGVSYYDPDYPLAYGVYIDNITCVRPEFPEVDCSLTNGDFEAESSEEDPLPGWTVNDAYWEYELYHSYSYGFQSIFASVSSEVDIFPPFFLLSQDANFDGRTNLTFEYSTTFTDDYYDPQIIQDPLSNFSVFIDDDLVFVNNESTQENLPEYEYIPEWVFEDIDITGYGYAGNHTITINLSVNESGLRYQSFLAIDNVCVYAPPEPECAPITGPITGNESTYENITFTGTCGTCTNEYTYHFEYSATPDGFTMYTAPLTLPSSETPNDSVEILSPYFPYIDGQTYYYRLARDDGEVGETLTFRVGAYSVTPVPSTTYTEEYFEPFVEAEWDIAELAGIVPVPYFAKFGYVLWAIFWGAILMAFWVRQEDVTIPSFMYLIIFFTLDLADLLPSSFVVVSWVFAGICLGAILYTLFRGRKHG